MRVPEMRLVVSGRPHRPRPVNEQRKKNLLILAAARFFFLDATAGPPATRRFGAGPVPLCSQLVWCECMLCGTLK